MTLFTEEQAIAAYEIADIVRSLDDSGNGEGIWEIIFVMDGRPYVYSADQNALPMDATDQEIKDKFIEIAQTREYKGPLKTFTVSQVSKV